MDFIQSLLPVEWALRLFDPDTSPGIHIYLHIKETDSVFRFKPAVSRYDVVEFLKTMHETDLLLNTPEFVASVSKLFLVDPQLNDKQVAELREQFAPFSKQSIIFMKDTQIEIEHNKTDNNQWLTTFTKKFNNNQTPNIIAVISNNDTLDTLV